MGIFMEYYKVVVLIATLSVVFMWSCDKITSTQEADVTMSEIEFPPYTHPGTQAEREATSRAPTYYCLVSTLMPKDAEDAYRYDAYKLTIPPGLLKKDNESGKTYEWITLTMGSRHAETRTEADPWRSRGVVRVAKCKIPPVQGILATLKKQLKEFNKSSWTYQNRELIEQESSSLLSGTATDWECTSVFVLTTCYYVGGALIGCTQEVLGCSTWTYHDDNAQKFNPNPGSGSSNPCASNVDGEIPSWCEDEPEPCETGDPIIDNSEYFFETLWENSDIDKPIEQRQEQGGFITRNSDGTLGFTLFPTSWPNFACGISPPQGWQIAIPSNTVGYVHTHPFFPGENTKSVCGEDGTENYTSGTNAWDLDFLSDIQNHLSDYSIKGYILDGGNIVTYGTLGTYNEDNRCGY